MIVSKEQIVQSLQEKVNTKIEMLRHQLAQSLFEAQLVDEAVKPNSSVVVYGKTYHTVAFKTLEEANKFMEKNDDWGFLAEKDGKYHCANMKDIGEGVEDKDDEESDDDSDDEKEDGEGESDDDEEKEPK